MRTACVSVGWKRRKPGTRPINLRARRPAADSSRCSIPSTRSTDNQSTFRCCTSKHRSDRDADNCRTRRHAGSEAPGRWGPTRSALFGNRRWQESRYRLHTFRRILRRNRPARSRIDPGTGPSCTDSTARTSKLRSLSHIRWRTPPSTGRGPLRRTRRWSSGLLRTCRCSRNSC